MSCQERKRLSGRETVIDVAVFAALLAIASAVVLALFYKQTSLVYSESYESDMAAYILEMQGLETKYSFPYPVFFKTAAFIDLFATPEFSVALAAMLFNSLGILITKVMFNLFLLNECGPDTDGTKVFWHKGILASVMAVSLFFISMLFPPKGIYLPGIRFTYLGVFTANPYHNATYVAARPFAILAFIWFVRLLPVYGGGLKKKSGVEKTPGAEKPHEADNNAAKLSDYIWFSVFLFLATMTKPSFTLVLVGAAGLIMLYRLFRAGFRNFIPTVQLGLCFVPTFAALLYQYSGVFVAKEGAEGGIGFTFGEVWGYYCDNIPLAIGLAIGFPLLVLVLNVKELKGNTLFRFSWQLYLMSFVMAFFLYEKGFRKPDFNFSWGYMYGIFFCHLAALTVLLKTTLKSGSGQKVLRRRLLLGAQWLAYLWHVACGIYYFLGIWSGQTYY